MKKRLCSIGMIIMLLLGFIYPITVQAKTPDRASSLKQEYLLRAIGAEDAILPRWSHVNRFNVSISASGPRLEGMLYIVYNSQGYVTSGTLYIERYNGNSWVTMRSVIVSQSGNVNQFVSAQGSMGYKYRTRFRGIVGGQNAEIMSAEIWL